MLSFSVSHGFYLFVNISKCYDINCACSFELSLVISLEIM